MNEPVIVNTLPGLRAVLGAGVIGAFVISTAMAQPALELVQTVPLPDVRGRIDHLGVDVDGERLFVAALGNDTVEVVDLRSGRRTIRLEHLREPQGVGYVADTKQLFVANGGSGRVDVFAGPELAAAAHVERLEDADNVRYDGDGNRIFVGYGRAMAVIDAASSKLLRRIELAGHPESFQLESSGPRIFINVPTAGQIAVVDRRDGSAIATWSLGDMKANFPMALDEPDRRLFVATRRPAALLVYDIDNGRRIASLPIGGDADDLFFDAEHKRIYAICGQGVVDVVQQRDPDRYETAVRLTTMPGARTGLFVPSRKTLYVAVPAHAASPAEIRAYAVK